MALVNRPIAACGALTPAGLDLYDSKRYQVRYPLIYVQGTVDPNTPMSQARYHEAGQVSAPFKAFVVVEGASHGPLIAEAAACTEGFWNQLVADRGGVTHALDACRRR